MLDVSHVLTRLFQIPEYLKDAAAQVELLRQALSVLRNAELGKP